MAHFDKYLFYDPCTGFFTWKPRDNNQWNSRYAGKKAGYLNEKGYIRLNVCRKSYYAHRVAWVFMKGNFPSCEIDHINGVRDDNRFINLRDVAHNGNQQNQRAIHRNNTSGFLGVSFYNRDKYWVASISIDGKTKRLGRFDTAELARVAYLEAKRKLHHTCTI